MITELKDLYIDDKNGKILLSKINDSLLKGDERYYVFNKPINSYYNLIWKCKDSEIELGENKNLIQGIPNKELSKIAAIFLDDTTSFKKSIDIYNCDGSALINGLIPKLKIDFKNSNTFTPSFLISWFNDNEIKEIFDMIGYELNIENVLKLSIEFPDYFEFAWIDTKVGTLSHVYCTKDFGRWLDGSKNIPKWYRK